jgi:hypothetical protein
VPEISKYLMRDPYYVPEDEVAVPESDGPPDLTETLEIVEKARAMLTPEDFAMLSSPKGKKTFKNKLI